MGNLVHVDGFDAELYLRLVGEDLLARGGTGSWGNRLTDAAKALLAVGVVDLPTVRLVCDDYALALSLRGMGGPLGLLHRGSPSLPPPQVLAGPRIVACDRAIPQPWGLLTLRYAVLRADATVLKVSLARDPVQAGKRGGRGQWTGAGPPAAGWHPPTIALADDRGTSATATFTNGGGSDLEWEGTYTAQPGLAQDAGWIELLGDRIRCLDHPAHGEVVVEPVAGGPAQRFLWHQVARATLRPGDVVDLPAMVAALEASGSLPPGDPDAAAAVSVADALQGAAFAFVPGRPAPGAGPAAGSLPEPWRSLLKARGRTGGPSGSVVVNVRTPVFDGISAGLMVLDSNENSYSLDVELSGAVATNRPNAATFDRQEVTWQGVDDRGNFYLGGMGQWQSSDHNASGTIQFWPALDRKATWLDLALATRNNRAVVRIRLAWDQWR